MYSPCTQAAAVYYARRCTLRIHMFSSIHSFFGYGRGFFFATLLTEAALNLSFEIKREKKKKQNTTLVFDAYRSENRFYVNMRILFVSFFISNSLTFSAMLITLEQRQDCPFSLVISTWYYQQVSPKGKYSSHYSRNQRCLSLAKNLFICSMRQQERMQRTFCLRTVGGEVNCQRERIDLSTRLMTVDL